MDYSDRIRPWDEVQEDFARIYPDLDEPQRRQRYEQATQMAQARLRAVDPAAEGSAAMEELPRYLLRRTPLIGSADQFFANRSHAAALQRLHAGTPERADYGIIANHEYEQQQEQNQGEVANALSYAPRVAGEAYLAASGISALGFAGGAAPAASTGASILSREGATQLVRQAAARFVSPSAWGRAAANTALTPSLWLPGWPEHNLRAANEAQETLTARRQIDLAGGPGNVPAAVREMAARDSRSTEELAQDTNRDPLHWRGLANSFTLGTMQNMVLGSLGGVANDLPGGSLGEFARNPLRAGGALAARTTVRVGAGLAEQQVMDVIAGTTGLQTGYGIAEDLYNGRYGDAAKHAIVQAATFAAFAGLHEIQEPRDFMNDTYLRSLRQLRRQGMSVQAANTSLAEASNLAFRLADAPDAQARATIESRLQGTAKDYALELQKATAQTRDASGRPRRPLSAAELLGEPDQQRAQGPQPGIDEMSGQPAQQPRSQYQPSPEWQRAYDEAVPRVGPRAAREYADQVEQQMRPGSAGNPHITEPRQPEAQSPAEAPQSVPAGQPARPGMPSESDQFHQQMANDLEMRQASAGWKLHLATDNPEAVSKILKEEGLTHKVGRSGQEGKDLTIYVGSREAAEDAAKIIERRAGKLLNKPHGEAAQDDRQFTDHVVGRFDIGSIDPEFHQYGGKDASGVPWLKADMDPFNRKPGARERAEAILKQRYGDFFSGPQQGMPSEMLPQPGGRQFRGREFINPREPIPEAEQPFQRPALPPPPARAPSPMPGEMMPQEGGRQFQGRGFERVREATMPAPFERPASSEAAPSLPEPMPAAESRTLPERKREVAKRMQELGGRFEKQTLAIESKDIERHEGENFSGKMSDLIDSMDWHDQRNRDIANTYLNTDRTLQDIGDQHGISKERVRQVIKKITDDLGLKGSLYERVKKYAKANREAMEQKDVLDEFSDKSGRHQTTPTEFADRGDRVVNQLADMVKRHGGYDALSPEQGTKFAEMITNIQEDVDNGRLNDKRIQLWGRKIAALDAELASQRARPQAETPAPHEQPTGPRENQTPATPPLDQPSSQGLPAGPGAQGAVGESAPAAAEANAPAVAGAAKASRMTDADIAKEISRLLHRGEDAAVEPYRDEQARRLGIEGVEPEAALRPSANARTPAPTNEGLIGGGQENLAQPFKRESALANAKIEADRKLRGESPILSEAAKTNPEVWDRAMSVLDKDPQASARLVDELFARPRATTIEENALLLHREVALKSEYANANIEGIKVYKNKASTPAELAMADARVDAARADLEKIEKVARQTGTEWGRAGQFRRQLVAEDYSLGSMLRQAEAAKKGELSKEEIATINEQAKTIEDLNKRIADLEAQGKPVLPGGEVTDVTKLRAKLRTAEQKFREDMRDYRESHMSTVEKVYHFATESMNALRAIKTGFDLSGILRQGGWNVFAHPLMSLKAASESLKAAKSPVTAAELHQAINERPNAYLYERAGLHIVEEGSHIGAHEENFMSRWAEKLPGISASERAYTSYLNRIRADLFDTIITSVAKDGKIDINEAKVIANFVNASTGRGTDFGYKKAFDVAANVFFAPRFVSSRIQLLTGQPFWGGTKATRMAIAKEYGRFLVGIGVMYGLAKTLDKDSVTFDPRSSDFGKIKLGDVRVDPLSGLIQPIVFSLRLATNTNVNEAGQERALSGEQHRVGTLSTDEVVGNFLRGKLAPIPGMALDIATRQNVMGEPTTAASVGANLLPMVSQDLYEVMTSKLGVPAKLAISLIAILGAGVQNHQQGPRPQVQRWHGLPLIAR